jgi:hypothetical protein
MKRAVLAALILSLGCASPAVPQPSPTPTEIPPKETSAETARQVPCGDGIDGQLRLEGIGSGDAWLLCNGKELVECPQEEGKPAAFALWSLTGLRCIVPQEAKAPEASE